MYKKSFHQMNDSGELNVFEAARYFSGGTNEVPGATFAHKIIGEDRQSAVKTARRMSLDVPPTMMLRHSLPLQMEKKMKEKKHKKPSSPGGKLAHFLNSLFNQTSSKKKSKSSTQSVKESEEESPGCRRKRRSSISFFHTITNTADSKSIYSSSSSGFRTPPPAPYTRNPTKRHTDYAFSDDKIRFSNGIFEKNKNSNLGYSNRSRKNWSERQFPSEEKEFRKINDFDDGADSDSSSDLFDLPNHDLYYYSSGLPVYETTHMNSIKRGPPISGGAI
ncbi:Hypothetical predicted protein [Olea europaea subsp. europaea]|uniref:Protein BIG GRAIN 1-like E n=1 Tax=Olea europaea subsp. europaea TaxID=158383 RepID=A0A8S0QLN6_OLEEU|nr:Hypothetical predicted protein [Olea europaea subsp. europaea]